MAEGGMEGHGEPGLQPWYLESGKSLHTPHFYPPGLGKTPMVVSPTSLAQPLKPHTSFKAGELIPLPDSGGWHTDLALVSCFLFISTPPQPSGLSPHSPRGTSRRGWLRRSS